MITKEELDVLITEIEQDRVEKTVSVANTDKFGEALCAFSNDFMNHRQPGYLIVGVHDDGRKSGMVENEKILQTLMDFRTDGRIVPPPLIQVKGFNYPDGFVAVAEVTPSEQTPVRYNGRVCIRIGPRKGYATEAEERILSEKRSSYASSFDSMPCFGSTVDDISVDIFKYTYLPTAIDEETLDANGREIKAQLASLKLYDLKADCPTNAALLLFGKNPKFYLPGAAVQYVHYTGIGMESEFDYEHRFEGDLITQMHIMVEFIKSQIIKKVLQNIGESHQYAYPFAAIKELLFNAIIHRDYQSNAAIKFYEYSDRIEISNAGGLYGRVNKDNFPKDNDYRNPVLAEAAMNMGFVNRFNQGIYRAIDVLRKNGNPDPVFIIEDLRNFTVIIHQKIK